jgi:predicted 3-demethylubiquinone-9 3-methyltransferase (glyoxalase superfamily)
MLLNGGPKFKPDEAFSLVVNCDTQDEIDFYWDKLIADGGQESMCGWLKDKYGISWQIIPVILEQLMTDPKKSERVVQAFLKMKKFNIQALLDA